MPFDADKHHRRSIRLGGYDYAQPGAYFITICAWNREYLFGDVISGGMVLSEYGRIVQEEWLRSARIRREIHLDAFVIMPNHVHGILVIRGGARLNTVGATGRSPRRTDVKHGFCSGNWYYRRQDGWLADRGANRATR